MARGRPLEPLHINDDLRTQLEAMTRSRSLSHALVRRASIILMSQDGLSNQQIAQHLQVCRATPWANGGVAFSLRA